MPNQRTFRSITEYAPLIGAESLIRGGTRIASCEIEFRLAKDNVRVAKLSYEDLFPRSYNSGVMLRRGGRFTEAEIRRLGQLQDGEYRVAMYVNGIRCSNVATIRIDKNHTPDKEPVFQLMEIEPCPGKTPSYLGVWVTGPSPADPDFKYSSIQTASLIVDGVERKREGTSFFGMDGPIKPGTQYGTMLELAAYKPAIKPGIRHEVKMRLGEYESPPITLSGDQPMGSDWDEAAAHISDLDKQQSLLSGKVLDSAGKPAEGWEIGLSTGDGAHFSEQRRSEIKRLAKKYFSQFDFQYPSDPSWADSPYNGGSGSPKIPVVFFEDDVPTHLQADVLAEIAETPLKIPDNNVALKMVIVCFRMNCVTGTNPPWSKRLEAVFLKCVHSKDMEVRRCVIGSLSRMPQDARKTLSDVLLKDRSREIREDTAKALKEIGK